MKYKYNVVRSPRFNRDLKKAAKRGLNPDDAEAVIRLLRTGEPLPQKYKDHPLHGEYEGQRDCHISPDWVLIYAKYEDRLILHRVRTGTHSDLFS